MKKEFVLKSFLKNITLNETENYKLIMDSTKIDSTKGYLFESICELLIISKCINGINYGEIKYGKYPNIHSLKDILKKCIQSQDGGVVDILVKNNKMFIPFSIKYNKFEPSNTDLSPIKNTYEKEKFTTALIVKDKKIIISHKYKDTQYIHKKLLDKVIDDNLLFDETYVIKG